MPSNKNLEKVSRWLSRWKPRLLLDKWAVMPSMEDKDPASKDGFVDMVVITVDTNNSEAWLRFYPRLWKESAEYQEMSTIHELAHIHTDHVRILLDKAVKAGVIDKQEVKEKIEDLTNTVAKIVYKVYQKKKSSSEYHI